MENDRNWSLTAAIEVCLPFNFTVVFDFMYFRFRPSKAKSIGNVRMTRQNAVLRFMFFSPLLCALPIDALNHFALLGNARRVGNFRQKNNSAEDGIDGTNGYFRRNSGCSAEQKTSEFRSESFRGRENNTEFRSVEQKMKQTLGIPFRTLPRKKKNVLLIKMTKQMVISDGIPAVPRNRKPRNSIPNPSAEEKTTRNSVP